MSTLLSLLWSVVWPIALLSVVVGLSYPVWVLVMGRLRLTDWLGYTSLTAMILLVQFRIVDVSVWWLVGTPVALALGMIPARRTLKRYYEELDFVAQGSFVVGHPPERVRDWPDWPWKKGADGSR